MYRKSVQVSVRFSVQYAIVCTVQDAERNRGGLSAIPFNAKVIAPRHSKARQADVLLGVCQQVFNVYKLRIWILFENAVLTTPAKVKIIEVIDTAFG